MRLKEQFINESEDLKQAKVCYQMISPQRIKTPTAMSGWFPRLAQIDIHRREFCRAFHKAVRLQTTLHCHARWQ